MAVNILTLRHRRVCMEIQQPERPAGPQGLHRRIPTRIRFYPAFLSVKHQRPRVFMLPDAEQAAQAGSASEPQAGAQVTTAFPRNNTH
jgi:hypothetical protein